jgi:hypothetical protein
MSVLRHSNNRHDLLTWRWHAQIHWLGDYPDPWGNASVTCSEGHVSQIQHNIQPDGALVAPPGCAWSMHCGHCNETLPLHLDGWAEHGPKRLREHDPEQLAAFLARCEAKSTDPLPVAPAGEVKR